MTMTDTAYNPGELILYTNTHLGLIIKPENGRDVWRVGLFIRYLTTALEDCIILDVNGKEKRWPTYMIQHMNDTMGQMS